MTPARDDARGRGARVVPLRPGDGRDGDGLADAIADRLGERRDRMARYYGRARRDSRQWLAETVAAVLAAPELRAPARLVLVALAAEIAAATARERERGPILFSARTACAPIPDLARATALSPRAVETALADLVRQGAVIRAVRAPGRPTIYQVDVAALSGARRRRTPRMTCVTSPASYAGGAEPSPARPDDDAADLARRRILSARLTPTQRAAALAALDRGRP